MNPVDVVVDESKKEKEAIDPLKRVFVFHTLKFRTHDGVYYQRDAVGSPIRRQTPKVRGKSARRADKLARRKS